MSKVSVVMAVYNCDSYVGYTIDSILSQSFQNFEFIIVDDGSTDNTLEVIRSYSDGRILLVSRANKGFAYSLNEGIGLATGDYIARIDADDIAYPNRLEIQYEYMEKNPTVSVLGSQAHIIDENGSEVGELRVPIDYRYAKFYSDYGCPLIHPTYFVRKGVYETVGGYQDITPGEDYDFLLRVVRRGLVVANVPNFLLKYRITSAGLTQSNPLKIVLYKREILRRHFLAISGGEDVAWLSQDIFYNKNVGRYLLFLSRLRRGLLAKADLRRGGLFLKGLAVLVSALHPVLISHTYRAVVAKLVLYFERFLRKGAFW